jgi:molecular chaperone DnaK (HSP70)
MSYAIDFGTSNTVVTRWNPVTEKPEVSAASAIELLKTLI